jgi:hypothetical protein
VYLLIVAVAWFTVTQVMGTVQSVSRSISTALDAVDSGYISADQLITGIFMGSLVIGIFALGIWVYQYSQRQAYLGG